MCYVLVYEYMRYPLPRVLRLGHLMSACGLLAIPIFVCANRDARDVEYLIMIICEDNPAIPCRLGASCNVGVPNHRVASPGAVSTSQAYLVAPTIFHAPHTRSLNPIETGFATCMHLGVNPEPTQMG